MVKNRSIILTSSLIVLLFLVSCSGKDTAIPNTDTSTPTQLVESPSPEITVVGEKNEKKTTAEVDVEVEEEELVIVGEKIVADVISVDVSGSANQYQFTVGVLSPDTGCEQYADWWEVLSEDGELIYRRILIHSHVNEQPFTRSGGAIDIDSDKVVIIRAHMNETGYGGTSMIGSVDAGFVTTVLLPDFAPGVENEPPLPTGCNF